MMPLVFHPPPGWMEADPPSLGLPEGSELAVDKALGWRAPAGEARASAACVGMDLHTWTEEVVPIAVDRLDGLVGSIVTRHDRGVTLRLIREERSGGIVERWLGSEGGAPVARTVLGFVGPRGKTRLEACFVVCAPADDACEQAVERSTAEGFVAPPPATIWVRAIATGARHPRMMATTTIALFLLVGIVLVWTRPRAPRK